MRRYEPEFRSLGARLLYITGATRERAEWYRQGLGLTAPVLLDPERRVYRIYGLRESIWGSALSPAVWLSYSRLLASGRRFDRTSRPAENPLQMGGDFIVGPDSRIAFAYCSAYSADRPDAAALVSIVRSLVASKR